MPWLKAFTYECAFYVHARAWVHFAACEFSGVSSELTNVFVFTLVWCCCFLFKRSLLTTIRSTKPHSITMQPIPKCWTKIIILFVSFSLPFCNVLSLACHRSDAVNHFGVNELLLCLLNVPHTVRLGTSCIRIVYDVDDDGDRQGPHKCMLLIKH